MRQIRALGGSAGLHEDVRPAVRNAEADVSARRSDGPCMSHSCSFRWSGGLGGGTSVFPAVRRIVPQASLRVRMCPAGTTRGDLFVRGPRRASETEAPHTRLPWRRGDSRQGLNSNLGDACGNGGGVELRKCMFVVVSPSRRVVSRVSHCSFFLFPFLFLISVCVVCFVRLLRPFECCK